MPEQPSASAAAQDPRPPSSIRFSGLVFLLSDKRPEATCEACDAVVALTNDAMYEHAARCPSKGWAHGV